MQHIVLPVLGGSGAAKGAPRFDVEIVGTDEIERRFHDLTLDIGVAVARNLRLKSIERY